MRRIIAILLALITVFSVVACNDKTTPSTPSTPSTPKENVNDTPKDDTNIVFAEDGKSTIYIVVPEKINTGISHGRQRLQILLKEMIGVNVLSGTMSDCEYEIHLGQTDDTAKALYAQLGEDKFTIKTEGKKLYVVAKDDLWLYDNVEYLVEEYLSNDEYVEKAEGSFVLKKAISKTTYTDENTIRYYLSKGGVNLKGSVAVAATASNSLSVGSDTTKIPHRRQGGCFSGTAYYQGLITDGEEYGMIMMKDLKTGETKFSELVKSPGHINDMEYNPNTNEVLFANGKTVYVFDGTTLELKKTIQSTLSLGGHLAYDPIKDQYIASRFTFVKSDFSGGTGKKLSEHPDYKNYNAKQGTSCDGYFLIALNAQSGAGANGGYNCHAIIYDMEGNLLGVVDVSIPEGYEPENVTIWNGDLYITGATPKPTATLYRVRLELPTA